MKKWIDANGFGELFLEIVLVRFDIPLLFVCVDKSKRRYLVLCVDEELGEYLVAKCSNRMLLAMLKGKVAMNEPFKKALGKKLLMIRYNFDCCTFESEYCAIEKITQDMLPDEGAYFELKNKKIENYLAKLEDEKGLGYNITIKNSYESFQTSSIYQYETFIIPNKEENYRYNESNIVYRERDICNLNVN